MWILTCFITNKKENLPKVTLKAQKGHVYTFSIKFNQLDPYIQTRRVDINIMKGTPAYRHGSLLYAPHKTLPYHYWFYGTIEVFLSKIKFSKWPFFLKIDAEGGKSKK